MKSILVFDHIQYKHCREQAEAMRGSDQPLNECIEFGRAWAKIGLGYAQQDYEAAKRIREHRRDIETQSAQLLRELEDLGESA